MLWLRLRRRLLLRYVHPSSESFGRCSSVILVLRILAITHNCTPQRFFLFPPTKFAGVQPPFLSLSISCHFGRRPFKGTSGAQRIHSITIWRLHVFGDLKRGWACHPPEVDEHSDRGEGRILAFRTRNVHLLSCGWRPYGRVRPSIHLTIFIPVHDYAIPDFGANDATTIPLEQACERLDP